MIDRRSVVVAAGLIASTGAGASLARSPRDVRQALGGWKLQIPGPRDIADPAGYAGRYFRVDDNGTLRFWVDCAEQGSTANSTFVRSELRHVANCALVPGATRSLTARMAVSSAAMPDKVTAMQIHGIMSGGDNAPPLLRVSVDQGALTAHIKTDAVGDSTGHVVLRSGVGAQPWSCQIRVEGLTLAVGVDGEEKLRRDLSFWPYQNYFKLGCYPQAHRGEVTVTARDLAVLV